MIRSTTKIRTPVEELFLREMFLEDAVYLYTGDEDDEAFDIMVPDTEELIENTGLFDNSIDYSSEMNEDEFDDIYLNNYGI